MKGKYCTFINILLTHAGHDAKLFPAKFSGRVITVELMFASLNMFLARLRLILARAALFAHARRDETVSVSNSRQHLFLDLQTITLAQFCSMA